MDPLAARLAPHLSRERAKTVFQALVRVPSPQTDLLEDEPQLRAFMETALLPRMKALGMARTRLDAMGNLIAEKGGGSSGRSLMLVSHAMNQPPSRRCASDHPIIRPSERTRDRRNLRRTIDTFVTV